MSCTLPKINAKLSFKIKIKCEYDFMHEKWEEGKYKRKQRATNSKRRESVDSRKGRNKVLSPSSVVEIKQKTK